MVTTSLSGYTYYLTRGDAGTYGYPSMGITTCAQFCNYIYSNGFNGKNVFWGKCYTLANGLNDNPIIDTYNNPNICVVQGNNVTDCSICKYDKL